jgi:hypothetical protein
MAFSRNCEGDNPKFTIRIIDRMFYQCPLKVIDYDAMEVLSMITICEGGGFGSSRTLPSQLLEETEYFFNARSIILGEQSRIEKWKELQKKDK